MVIQKKHSFLLLLLLPLFVFSQDLDKKISFSVANASPEEVLVLITEKSGIDFSYSPAIFENSEKISVNVRRKSVRFILDNLFVPSGIEYELTDLHVVLRRTSAAQSAKSAFRENKKYTLSGFLRDKATGEALIGANVYESDSYTGSTANAYGFYSLTLPGGVHRLTASFIGYGKKETVIELTGDKKMNFDLDSDPVEIREVEVLSGKGAELLNEQGLRLSSTDLARLPGFAGEQDVIRSLQVVPGIQSYGDGSTLFYVRGGNSDQNLILIDDAPIYNPSHMFGFFSVLAPDAIREADIYKGDAPAEYGGRLSSVIDIKAKNGNLKKFGCSGNLGPYASALSVEGPVVKDKGSFFASGRISTVNWLDFLNRTSTTFKQNFYDLNAKINYKLNGNNRLFLTFYYGEDSFERTSGTSIMTYGISWNNIATILRWNHTFNPRVFSNTTAYYSRYTYFLYTSSELNQYWTSGIENLALKNNLTWYISPSNTLKAGFEAAWHHSNPGNVNFRFSDSQKELKSVSEYYAMEYVLYASDELKIGKKLAMTIGLRLPLWQDIGPSSVYYFNVNHQVIDTMQVGAWKSYAWYFRPEPRVNIRYKPDERSVIKLDYSGNSQFMQVLSTSTSPFTSLEVWSFSGPNAAPRRSDLISAGYSRIFRNPMYDMSADLYYKWITNNIDYRDHANMFYNPLIEGEIRTGNARSYGIELMFRKRSGQWTGWLAYTFSRALNTTPEVNSGKEYPAYYDRPHNLCANFAWTKNRFSFSATWVLMSGAAVTSPTGFYYYNGYSVPLYGDRNSGRLPVYHRLDVSAEYRINKPERKFQHSVIFTVYNVYGRDNMFSVSFNRTESGNQFVVPSNMYGGYDLVPTSLSVAGIIPSINYQFRF